MKIDSFRELLIKKTNDPNLQALIGYMKDDYLTQYIIESLMKMATSSEKKVNDSLKHFGTEMDDELTPHMIHDALSHHGSSYKVALHQMQQTPEGSPKHAQLKKIANQHMKQFFKIMHMSQKLVSDRPTNKGEKKNTDHTNGKLQIKEISPMPWERHAYPASTNAAGWARSTDNYTEFLPHQPAPSYKSKTDKHGHKGAYPLEETQINGKYLDINPDLDAPVTKFTPHEFDKHPILSVYKGEDEHKPENVAAYKKAHEAFEQSPEYEALANRHEEQGSSRGSTKSSSVHREATGFPPNSYETAGASNKQDAAAKLASILAKPKVAPKTVIEDDEDDVNGNK